MFHRRNWIAVVVVILGLLMFTAVTQAQRQESEGIACYSQTRYFLHSSPEIAIFGFDQKGIYRSTDKSKLFDN